MSVQPPPRRPIVGDPIAVSRAHERNIDRRKCHRVVPLQVLCLGVSRTGTSSVRQALLDLGYNDVYHYAAILNENPRDAEMWTDAIQSKFEGAGTFELSGTRDWDRLLGHCAAVTDTPCAIFYKELLAAYPFAKVVLTVRDSPMQWWESQMASVMKVFDPPQSVWQRLRTFFLPKDSYTKIIGLILEHYRMYSLLMKDRTTGTREAITWYEDYVEEIKQLVPSDRLLVMNVKEGWGPLCKFLGKDQPPWAWPRVNDRQTFNQNLDIGDTVMDGMAIQAMYKSAGKVLGLFAVAGLGIWLKQHGW